MRYSRNRKEASIIDRYMSILHFLTLSIFYNRGLTNTDARFKIISLLNNIVIERGEQYAPCKRKAAGGSAGGWEAGIYGKRLPGSILKKHRGFSWSNDWGDLPLLYGQGGIV